LLSDLVSTDVRFREAVLDVVERTVLPWMRSRLVDLGAVPDGPEGEDDDGRREYYVQFPPTLRLQPGPSGRDVRPHTDGEYGHQMGELNFWVPLTDVGRTRTTLHVEEPGGGKEGGRGGGGGGGGGEGGLVVWGVRVGREEREGERVEVDRGGIAAFHGTSWRHYVPANGTGETRVSLDFRVGVQGFFDPKWSLKGTTDEHARLVFLM